MSIEPVRCQGNLWKYLLQLCDRFSVATAKGVDHLVGLSALSQSRHKGLG